MNKVEKRREKSIQFFVIQNNWNEVSRLLNQPYENALRRDRIHHLLSLNERLSKTKNARELGDNLIDPTLDPLYQLLQKEKYVLLYQALFSLTRTHQQIVIGYVLEKKSYRQLAKEIGFSDKTIKQQLDFSMKMLKIFLNKQGYYH